MVSAQLLCSGTLLMRSGLSYFHLSISGHPRNLQSQDEWLFVAKSYLSMALLGI
ncbi:hypothetical protein OSCI_2460020 [Kamptonema sp. PCC 6506]|nr:hypothetical protein OSCI_2460020 [Kamptonema sp. PCC 6506]